MFVDFHILYYLNYNRDTVWLDERMNGKDIILIQKENDKISTGMDYFFLLQIILNIQEIGKIKS